MSKNNLVACKVCSKVGMRFEYHIVTETHLFYEGEVFYCKEHAPDYDTVCNGKKYKHLSDDEADTLILNKIKTK